MQSLWLGAMHDNLILPTEPIGVFEGKANVDLGNTLTKEVAIRALAMLKTVIAGREIKEAERKWNPGVKESNLELIEKASELKGRLGFMKIPLRMLITDYELKVGQEVVFSMTMPEVISEEPNKKEKENNENEKHVKVYRKY